VIGGLLASTLAILLLLPLVFAGARAMAGSASASLDPDDSGSSLYEPGKEITPCA
jgi:hypothetical protein